MDLTIGSFKVATLDIQGVNLRSILGAYELVFALRVEVLPAADFECLVSITGARVAVKSADGKTHQLGFARSDEPFEMQQRPFPASMSRGLVLAVPPSQLAAIDDVRDAGDLQFELTLRGTGIDQHGDQMLQDTKLLCHLGRSDWVKKLREARARDILLLEVPIPFAEFSADWSEIAGGLKRAEGQFRKADYHSCVATCRTVIQELGAVMQKDPNWANAVLDRLGRDRRGMSKAEREVGLWGALRHYTHQSHHAESEGGVGFYSRSEAQQVLTLTAAFVTRAQSK